MCAVHNPRFEVCSSAVLIPGAGLGRSEAAPGFGLVQSSVSSHAVSADVQDALDGPELLHTSPDAAPCACSHLQNLPRIPSSILFNCSTGERKSPWLIHPSILLGSAGVTPVQSELFLHFFWPLLSPQSNSGHFSYISAIFLLFPFPCSF